MREEKKKMDLEKYREPSNKREGDDEPYDLITINGLDCPRTIDRVY